jgi:4-hydroxy-3-methylbut-2-enyl diphosphate reductase
MSEQTVATSFEEMLDASLVSLRTGTTVKGTVVRVTPTEVIVDLGFKSDGIISRTEFIDDPNADLTQLTKPGDTFEVWVLRVNDGDGNVVVSKKRADGQLNYKHIEQAFTDKTPIRGKVTEIVKNKEGTAASGMIVNIMGTRAFVPASLASNYFEKNLDDFKGKEFDFQIIEMDKSKKRIVASRKELAAAEAQQRRDDVFASIAEGQRIEGVVSRIVDFGAFVDIGGVDGLVHVSEVSWKRIRKVSDVLNVGDRVVAEVIKVDSDKGKISLSLKDSNANPWKDILERFPIDEIVEGTVVRLASFGAFVSLADGVDGLVHISQIANKHVAKPSDELQIGDVIKVKVLGIDLESQKISLSKRETEIEEVEETETEEVIETEEMGTEVSVVEDDTTIDAEAVIEEPANESASPVEEIAETTDSELDSEEVENNQE